MSGQETWRRLRVPAICERIIGFSVPQADQVLVISYEGAHLLRLVEPIEVAHAPEHPEYDIYDPETGSAEFRGARYSILGLHGGSPILSSPQGERLELDRTRERLYVTREGRTVFETQYENSSGDWSAATFSPDGRFIVLACPYDFDFRAWERAAAR